MAEQYPYNNIFTMETLESPVDVASAEIWEVAKLCWENLPRLRQVVAENSNYFYLLIAKIMVTAIYWSFCQVVAENINSFID